MTIMKHIQCDWCFARSNYGKTMVYEMKAESSGTTNVYQPDRSSCEFRYEEEPGYTVKHICKSCIDHISPPQKTNKSKDKSGI